jgi:FLVCR family MFS transporter 7
VQGALREGPDAHPPLNMRRALIFNGVFVMSCSALIFLVQGRQARKELDEQKIQAQEALVTEQKGTRSQNHAS